MTAVMWLLAVPAVLALAAVFSGVRGVQKDKRDAEALDKALETL